MAQVKTAYSYIRFSSERQYLGDSLRRQLALAEAYAAKHGLELDTQSYRDMGISAYKGRNAVEGKLATFLRAVDGGLIPPGSLLLIESLDRLSRHDVDEALELFLSIIRRGITIVTLNDGQEYCRASIKRDRGISLIISITVMMRAHEESATKSARCKAAWATRTAKGGVLTKQCPTWIKFQSGRWRVDRKRAKVVQDIFKMYLEGVGCCTIARVLNERDTPIFQRAAFWSPGLVTRVLNNKAVYGTMGREHAADIENYYPAIVDRKIFDRARILAKSRTWKGGEKVPYPPNLFIGVAYCAGCGSRFRQTSGVEGSYRLRCARAYCRAGCDAVTVSGSAAEAALVKDLLLAKHMEPTQSAEWVEAAAQIVALEQVQASLRRQRDQLITAALAANDAPSMAADLARVEGHLNEVYVRLQQHRETARPRHSADLMAARHICAALVGGKAAATESWAMREKLKVLTNRMLARVDFHPTLPRMVVTFEAGTVSTIDFERPAVGFQTGNTFAHQRWARTAVTVSVPTLRVET